MLGIVWTVLFAAVVFADRYRASSAPADLSAGASAPTRDPVVLVLSALAAAAAVLVTVWLIRTGHAGAESRWG